MENEDLNLNNGSVSLVNITKLINGIRNIDLLEGEIGETVITSKFPNIYYYKSITKLILVNRNFKLLEEFHYNDSYTEMRIVDFLKDASGNISANYTIYYNDFLDDSINLINAYVNSTLYPQWGYEEFRSKIFKQYIINIAHICIDIFECYKIR
ncbi:MAG: hypothetical protein DRJ64_01625 [Thermoprotei archaeon]|nr:MAG: hypothetical protein DRJ64_01625 [Thermoprotei archaeon]